MSIIEKARKIAREAHEGQYRKWGDGSPYIIHPERVAKKVSTLSGITDVDIAAALAHDLIEDVAIPLNKQEYYEELLISECGQEVLDLVLELTNPTHTPEWKNRSRAEKRVADWEHLSKVSDRAKRIKMCDRLDNVTDMKKAPIRMIQKYVPESLHLLSLCQHVDEELAQELKEAIEALQKQMSN